MITDMAGKPASGIIQTVWSARDVKETSVKFRYFESTCYCFLDNVCLVDLIMKSFELSWSLLLGRYTSLLELRLSSKFIRYSSSSCRLCVWK